MSKCHSIGYTMASMVFRSSLTSKCKLMVMARKFITLSLSGAPTPRPARSINQQVTTTQSTTRSRPHKSKEPALSTIITRPPCIPVFSLMLSMWTSHIIWWCQAHICRILWLLVAPLVTKTKMTCSIYRTCTHRVNHQCLSSRCRTQSGNSGQIILIIRVRWPTSIPHLGPFTTRPRSAVKGEYSSKLITVLFTGFPNEF